MRLSYAATVAARSVTSKSHSDHCCESPGSKSGKAAPVLPSRPASDPGSAQPRRSIAYIAQNGIQISYGATATVKGNTVSRDNYTPTSNIACGLLFFQAAGVKASNNNLFDNEVNLCNVGRGGGHYNP
jgi:hypothetical protein